MQSADLTRLVEYQKNAGKRTGNTTELKISLITSLDKHAETPAEPLNRAMLSRSLHGQNPVRPRTSTQRYEQRRENLVPQHL